MLQHRRRRVPKPIKPWKGPKPRLPMLISHQYRVHFLDLQAYLTKVLKMQDCDIRSITGGTTECCPEFIVTKELPDARNIGQQIDAIRRGRKTRNLALILIVLCFDGFIPAGKYIIDMTPLPNPIIAYTELLHEHHDPTHAACMAFKKKHPDEAFTRRARVLDNFATFKQEKPDA